MTPYICKACQIQQNIQWKRLSHDHFIPKAVSQSFYHEIYGSPLQNNNQLHLLIKWVINLLKQFNSAGCINKQCLLSKDFLSSDTPDLSFSWTSLPQVQDTDSVSKRKQKYNIVLTCGNPISFLSKVSLNIKPLFHSPRHITQVKTALLLRAWRTWMLEGYDNSPECQKRAETFTP